MSGAARWQIAGVGSDARDLARATAKKLGVGVGDWLDAVIRHRTGLPGGAAAAGISATLDDLPVDLLDTLEALETRVAERSREVEAAVLPLKHSVESLSERLHSLVPETPDDAENGDASGPGSDAGSEEPLFIDGKVPSEADRRFAETTIAGDLGRLFDDGTHTETQRSDTARGETGATVPPRRDDPSVSHSMLVAGAIVIVLIAVGVTLYQWSQTSVVPDGVSQIKAMPEPAAPPSPTGGTERSPRDPARPDETIEPKTLRTSKTVSTAPEPTDPSFTAPVAPAVPDADPVAALHRSATAGDQRAQYDLATIYIRGENVARNYAAAAYWLREAAIAGLAQAQYNLGVMYDLGLAGKKDAVEALIWFHAAADQQHGRAYYALGRAYDEGKGIAHNTQSARLWFTRGAEAGIADSQLALGVMFDEGLGGSTNAGRAYYWYRRAELGGNVRAADRIAGLANRLSTAERSTINDEVSRAITPALARPPAVASTPAQPALTAASRPADAPFESSKETVRAVQLLLTELGFDPGPADGDAGPRTRTAVEDYQRALDLPVDGRPGPGLLTHLRELTGHGTSN